MFDGKIYSVIVFSDRCEFKDVTIFSDDVILTQQFQLAASIQKYTNKTIFNQEKINKYYDLLYPYTQLTEEQKQEHIKNLQERMNLRRLQQNKVCPRCGSKLVLRVAKKGRWPDTNFMVVQITQNADIPRIKNENRYCYV